jgi:hypothetical protein
MASIEDTVSFNVVLWVQIPPHQVLHQGWAPRVKYFFPAWMRWPGFSQMKKNRVS